MKAAPADSKPPALMLSGTNALSITGGARLFYSCAVCCKTNVDTRCSETAPPIRRGDVVLEGRGYEAWEGGTLQSVINILYKSSLSIRTSSSVSWTGPGAGGSGIADRQFIGTCTANGEVPGGTSTDRKVIGKV